MDFFKKLVTLKEALVSAVQSKNADAIRKAWTAFVVVGDVIFGAHVHEMAAAVAAKGEDVDRVVEEIKACCKTVRTEEAAGDTDGGKWAVLAQIVQVLLPLILRFFQPK